MENEKEIVNMETLFEDYRDVDGIKIAHHLTRKSFEYRETLIAAIKLKIADIKLNAEIDEALFHLKE